MWFKNPGFDWLCLCVSYYSVLFHVLNYCVSCTIVQWSYEVMGHWDGIFWHFLNSSQVPVLGELAWVLYCDACMSVGHNYLGQRPRIFGPTIISYYISIILWIFGPYGVTMCWIRLDKLPAGLGYSDHWSIWSPSIPGWRPRIFGPTILGQWPRILGQ